MSTIYISISGSDSTGDGTISAPFLSIDKAYYMANTSDIIHLLSGTYNVYTTLNVTKPLTFTGTDAIINGTGTVFNIQTNDVHINNLTIESSHLTNPVISIDRNSTGSTVPTYYTGNSITYCTIQYTVKGLYLNGTYTIDHNNFRKCTGTYSAHVISIYSSRGICSISNNTVLDSEHIQYVIYLTSSGSGSFLNACNSKIGTLTIQDNTITLTKLDSTSIIYQDYFNTYVVSGNTEVYNNNTKLNMIIRNNVVTTAFLNIFINLLFNSPLSCLMFGHITINNNTNNSTIHGIIHFNKLLNSTNVNIISSDQNRPIFKIYDNVLHSTHISAYMYAHFDAIDNSTILNVNSLPCSVGENIAFVTNKGLTPNITLSSNVSTEGPTYEVYNGFKSIYFISDPRKAYLRYNSNILETLVFSYVIVCKINSDISQSLLLSYNNNGGMEYAPYTDGTLYLSNGNAGFYSMTPNITLGTVYIIVVSYGYTHITYNTYQKNTNTSTVNVRSGMTSTPNAVYLGNTPFNSFMGNTIHANVFEYRIYNKELISTEITPIVEELRIKYYNILS